MPILRYKDWKAEILPEFGMNTVSLSWKEKDVLRSPANIEELAAKPCVYGTPILFPPNRTAEGLFVFDGEQYKLPVTEAASNCNLHGLIYGQPFEVIEQSENVISGKVENTGELFPFSFVMQVSCCLSETGYEQRFIIKNTGNIRMPLTYGLHTTFVCRNNFIVPLKKKYERDSRNLPTGKLMELSGDELCYTTGYPNDRAVSGYFSAAGNTAVIDDFEYTVSSGFDHWTLWNGGGGKGFISVEPQSGAVNCLNNGIGLKTLDSGEMCSFQTLIKARK